MDEQIVETVRTFFADLEGVKTSEFYNAYLEICKEHKVEARAKNIVIREACDICGIKTKQKHITYTVFEGERSE